MIPVTELAWAAGFMEGEGSVMIRRPTVRNRGALIVSTVNTDLSLVAFFHERWGGSMKPATGLRPDQRPATVWTTAAVQALAFLDEIEPYVVCDRMKERITTARWWQEIKGRSRHWLPSVEEEEEFACWLYMKELNVRGVAA